MRAMSRFNDWLALKITDMVGTMWCAYAFAVLALLSLPDAIRGGMATLIAWTAQTFLQLTLLSVIIIGQKLSGEVAERRDIETHDRVMAEFDIVKDMHRDIHEHLGIDRCAD